MIPDPNVPLTAADLARYLFGNPLDPQDTGIIGRMMAAIDQTNRRMTRLLLLGWAVLLTIVGAMGVLIASLLQVPPHH